MDILHSPRRVMSRIGDESNDTLPEMSPCYSPRRVSRFSSHSNSTLSDVGSTDGSQQHCEEFSEQSGTSNNDRVMVYFSPLRSPRRKRSEGSLSAAGSPSKSTMSSICSSARRRMSKLMVKGKSPLGGLAAPPLDLDTDHQSTSKGSSILTDKQAKDLCAKIQAKIDDDLMPREEDLQSRIESEQELAGARYTNGSEAGALVSLRKARNLSEQRSRVTWAIDVAMDALWEVETKMARAQEKSARKAAQKAGKAVVSKDGEKAEKSAPNVHYKLDFGEHANILSEVENILSANDNFEEDKDEDEDKNSDEELLQELHELVSAK